MYATTGLTGSEAEFACLRNTFDTIGFVAIRNDRTQAIAQDLSREARDLTDDLQRAVRDDGELTYSAGIAPLGRQAQGFLTGAELSEVMHALTGARHALSNDMSCLTHYGAGDQLGPHVDQPAERCAVTCILYLTCQSPDASAADTGLQLRIFGPLSPFSKFPQTLSALEITLKTSQNDQVCLANFAILEHQPILLNE